MQIREATKTYGSYGPGLLEIRPDKVRSFSLLPTTTVCGSGRMNGFKLDREKETSCSYSTGEIMGGDGGG
jgi:hypothetical protein